MIITGKPIINFSEVIITPARYSLSKFAYKKEKTIAVFISLGNVNTAYDYYNGIYLYCRPNIRAYFRYSRPRPYRCYIANCKYETHIYKTTCPEAYGPKYHTYFKLQDHD